MGVWAKMDRYFTGSLPPGEHTPYTILCFPPFESTLRADHARVTLEIPSSAYEKAWFFGGFSLTFAAMVMLVRPTFLLWPAWAMWPTLILVSCQSGLMIALVYRLLIKQKTGYTVERATGIVVSEARQRPIVDLAQRRETLTASVLPGVFVTRSHSNVMWTGMCVCVLAKGKDAGQIVACVSDHARAMAYAQKLKDHGLVGAVIEEPARAAILTSWA